MAYALNGGFGLILAWILYGLSRELVRSLKTGTWQGRMFKGVVIRRNSEPALYWVCMVALAAGVVVFALLLGGLASHWIDLERVS